MIQVIRCYGSSLQPVVSAHLEQNLKNFLNQQPPIRERAKPLATVDVGQVRAVATHREEHADHK
jgi:polyhydroxyalkanoate synthesis regulator protein